MTPLEAKTSLSFHSCRNEDVHNPKWQNGFLGMLRPYRGKLIEENFHEVIACLMALSGELRSGPTIDREITGDILGIIHLTRIWAFAPNGMLRRNKLITDHDRARLEDWIYIIEDTFLLTLESSSLDEVYNEYRDYCDGTGSFESPEG